jgi:hypothetical protein
MSYPRAPPCACSREMPGSPRCFRSPVRCVAVDIPSLLSLAPPISELPPYAAVRRGPPHRSCGTATHMRRNRNMYHSPRVRGTHPAAARSTRHLRTPPFFPVPSRPVPPRSLSPQLRRRARRDHIRARRLSPTSRPRVPGRGLNRGRAFWLASRPFEVSCV